MSATRSSLWGIVLAGGEGQWLEEFVRVHVMLDLVAYFEMLQRYVGDAQEYEVAREVYRMIPSTNFAATVLARRFQRLLELPTRNILWSDWGKKERILQTMFDLGRYRYPSTAAPRAGLAFSA